MRGVIGFLALLLGSVGLTACVAALAAVWIVRPSFLRSSAEALDTAEGALTMVEQQATRADEVLRGIRELVDPIAGKISTFANTSDEKQRKQLEDELFERLRQIDSAAGAAVVAMNMLGRTSRFAQAFGASGNSTMLGMSPEEVASLSKKLGDLRDVVAKVRDNKEVLEKVLQLSRQAFNDLDTVDAKLQLAHREAVRWHEAVVELRTTVPVWTDRAAIVGTVVLAWLGLGQLTLSCWGWRRMRASPV